MAINQSTSSTSRVGGRFAEVPVVERFWSKVRKSDGCWEWTGSVAKTYGKFWDGKRSVRAHRFSWELHNGREVPAGKCICHHCDNRLCVRPDHLFDGTQKDNVHDARAKGRLWGEGPYRKGSGLTLRGGKVFCRRGHDVSELGLFVCRRRSASATVGCRRCKREDAAAVLARKRARKEEKYA